MIVWVSKDATGYPNDQRAEVKRVDCSGRLTAITVEMCGGGETHCIKTSDIVGIELDDGRPEGACLSLMIKVVGARASSYSSARDARVRTEESDEFRKFRFCRLCELHMSSDDGCDEDGLFVTIMDAVMAIPDNLIPVASSLAEAAGNTVSYLRDLSMSRTSLTMMKYHDLRTHLNGWWKVHGRRPAKSF